MALTQGSPAPSGDVHGCHARGGSWRGGSRAQNATQPPVCSGRPPVMTQPCVRSAGTDSGAAVCVLGGRWGRGGRGGRCSLASKTCQDTNVPKRTSLSTSASVCSPMAERQWVHIPRAGLLPQKPHPSLSPSRKAALPDRLSSGGD